MVAAVSLSLCLPLGALIRVLSIKSALSGPTKALILSVCVCFSLLCQLLRLPRSGLAIGVTMAAPFLWSTGVHRVQLHQFVTHLSPDLQKVVLEIGKEGGRMCVCDVYVFQKPSSLQGIPSLSNLLIMPVPWIWMVVVT